MGDDDFNPLEHGRPVHWSERDHIDEVAEILIEAYCDAEELDGVSPSYVATFVDMAKAVIDQVRPTSLRGYARSRVIPLRTGVPFTMRTDGGDDIEFVLTNVLYGGPQKWVRFEGQDLNSVISTDTWAKLRRTLGEGDK